MVVALADVTSLLPATGPCGRALIPAGSAIGGHHLAILAKAKVQEGAYLFGEALGASLVWDQTLRAQQKWFIFYQ